MIKYEILINDIDIEKFHSISIQLSDEDLKKLKSKEVIHLINDKFESVYGLASKTQDSVNVKFISGKETLIGKVLPESPNVLYDFIPFEEKLKLEIQDLFDYISVALAVESNNLYRGQAVFEWDLLPSVFRSTPPPEKEIYTEIKQHNHKDFTKDDFIEVAVNMQHYGIPTRLLDWTSNSLHALYFACVSKENENEDGAVFLVSVDNLIEIGSEEEDYIADFIKYKYLNGNNYENVFKFFDRITEEGIYHYFFKTKYYNDRIRNQKGYFSIYFEQTEEEIKMIKNKKYNDIRFIGNNLDLSEVHINNILKKIKELRFPIEVENNRQFEKKAEKIIDDFPINNEKNKISIIREISKILIYLNKMIPREHNMNNILRKDNHFKILIPKEAKETIVKQLDDMGINSSTIYPDVEGLSRYLKEKYITTRKEE